MQPVVFLRDCDRRRCSCVAATIRRPFCGVGRRSGMVGRHHRPPCWAKRRSRIGVRRRLRHRRSHRFRGGLADSVASEGLASSLGCRLFRAGCGASRHGKLRRHSSTAAYPQRPLRPPAPDNRHRAAVWARSSAMHAIFSATCFLLLVIVFGGRGFVARADDLVCKVGERSLREKSR